VGGPEQRPNGLFLKVLTVAFGIVTYWISL
jgi:hypothetical protein